MSHVCSSAPYQHSYIVFYVIRYSNPKDYLDYLKSLYTLNIYYCVVLTYDNWRYDNEMIL